MTAIITPAGQFWSQNPLTLATGQLVQEIIPVTASEREAEYKPAPQFLDVIRAVYIRYSTNETAQTRVAHLTISGPEKRVWRRKVTLHDIGEANIELSLTAGYSSAPTESVEGTVVADMPLIVLRNEWFFRVMIENQNAGDIFREFNLLLERFEVNPQDPTGEEAESVTRDQPYPDTPEAPPLNQPS